MTASRSADILDRILLLPVNDRELAANCLETGIERTPIYFAASMLCFVFLSYSYHGFAPFWLSTVFPIVLFSGAGLRIAQWLKAPLPETQPDVNARLRRFAVESILLIGLLSLWPLMLVQYANAFLQMLTASNFAMVTLVCVYCMMHMRAAIVISLAVTPAAIFYLVFGVPFSLGVGFNGIFLSTLICTGYMVHAYAKDFDALIAQRSALQDLSHENFRIANIDSLTGLANRRRFFSDLAEREHIRPSDDGYVIAIIDLDGFKPINDIYGHACGDRALAVTADRLETLCREIGLAYRLGGDEFAIILDKPGDDDALMHLAQRAIDTISAPFTAGGNQLSIGASIGFARYPQACAILGKLYESADYALYRAKRMGRRCAVIFNKEHEAAMRNTGLLEYHLKSAEIEREFQLVYQPMIDYRSGSVVAFEALARWTNPVLGPVNPADFIPAAERIGMIDGLTEHFLSIALDALASWPPQVRLSFNLSAYDICADNRAEKLIELVHQKGIDLARIEFELTETAVMHNFRAACANMEALRKAGARLSLDDFGTGYSSLSHLNRLPLDKLKIDRSFVCEIDTKDKSYKIVQSLSLLARELEIDCVAEGVENEHQAAILTAVGCHVMQGYYFSRPLARDAAEAFLQIHAGTGMQSAAS